MLIDFEDRFSKYLTEYIHENEIKDEQLEQIVPELYLEWLGEKKDWLNGESPIGYFEKFDAAMLIKLLGEYIFSDVTLPGVLLNRVADMKKETYPHLISLLKNYEGEKSDVLKTTVVRLLEEMDMPHPYDYYISTIANTTEKSDFSERCCEELKNTGQDYIAGIISAYESTSDEYASDCFLDILTDLPQDDRTYEFALEKFLYSDAKKAFYASCLGKIGNDKALPYLEEGLKDEDIAYYDYVAIKNALEELGGEINIERDFSGDKDYESLKNIGE